MTREIALHCMKSYSELHSDLCELCPIYGETGSDHCFEDALQYVIGMLEQEPTIKNDLADDKTFYEQMVEYCNEHFLVLVEKDVWEDVRKALTTKNDLGVDCISRAEVLKIFDEWFATCNIADKKESPKAKIKALPSVTPQEPRCEEREKGECPYYAG